MRLPRSWPGRLALVVLAGAALRLAFVVGVTRHDDRVYDALWYELQARAVVDGHFFDDPYLLFEEPPVVEPNADHPPLTVVVLAPAALLGPHDWAEMGMRLTMVLIGSGTVAGAGLLARRLAGPAAGLLAAGLAAVDPNLWMNDGLIMSESLATLLTLVAVAGAYRAAGGDHRPRVAVALGVTVGLCALTRAELALLGPLLVAPAVLAGHGASRWRRLVLAGTACVAVLAPWVAFNTARFERPTTVSTTLGLALRAGNCPSTFSGELIGWADVFPPCTEARGPRDPSQWDADLRDDALAYIGDHPGQLPAVVAARVGRTWGLYRPGQTNALTKREGRPEWASWLGTVWTWLALPVAAYGVVLAGRLRVRRWPLLVPLAATTAVAAALSGLARYRAPGEPAMLVLVAIGVVALAGRARGRPRHGGGGDDHNGDSDDGDLGPRPLHAAL